MSLANVFRIAPFAALLTLSCDVLADGSNTAPDEIDNPAPAWGWSDIYKTEYGKARTLLGTGLYTTRKKSYGVGFRCEKNKLYAFVAVKKVNVRDTMIRISRGRRSWDVRYSIDGAEEIEEEWISVHNGLMFMVKSRSTSFAIFEAARQGKTLVVRPKNGKTVSIEMPVDTTGIFDKFRGRCGPGVGADLDFPARA